MAISAKLQNYDPFSHSASTDDCSVCLQPFLSNASGIGHATSSLDGIKAVFHRFHTGCWLRWEKRRTPPNCPDCRAEIGESVKKRTFNMWKIGSLILLIAGRAWPTEVIEPIYQPVNSTCSVDQLHQILDLIPATSATAAAFAAFNETIGISTNNCLLWKPHYFQNDIRDIDGIKSSDLSKPVQWGIDIMGRPFIALKYRCETSYRFKKNDEVSRGVVTLFNYFSPIYANVPVDLKIYWRLREALAITKRNQECVIPLHPAFSSTDDFNNNLHSFLKGETVKHFWDYSDSTTNIQLDLS